MNWIQGETESLEKSLKDKEEVVTIGYSESDLDAIFITAVSNNFLYTVRYLLDKCRFYFIFDIEMILSMSNEMIWLLIHRGDLISHLNSEVATKWFSKNFPYHPIKKYNKTDLIVVLYVVAKSVDSQDVEILERYKNRLNCYDILYGLSAAFNNFPLFTELMKIRQPTQETIQYMWEKSIALDNWKFLQVLYKEYGIKSYNMFHLAKTEIQQHQMDLLIKILVSKCS